ncbi:MAG TPA: energy transducer TonB [Pyrinomonadaceae bacterium]|jgi:TonB family protein
MLNQLIESRNHGADNRKRGGFLLATFFLVGSVLSSGVLWSLFAKDLAMGGEGLELSAIIAPVPEVKNEPPAPVQKQQARPQKAQASTAPLPVRRTNTARIDEMQPAPSEVSVAATTERARPNGEFSISDKDIDPRSFGSGEERSGNDTGRTGISEGDKPTQPEIVEKIPPPPPLIVKKITEEAAQKPKPPKSLGVINGKAINLPVPVYSAAAKAINAAGNVDVQVVIDESGAVVSAKAVSGHPLLRDSAERAARGARFSPTTLSRQAVKVTGVIVYKFSK